MIVISIQSSYAQHIDFSNIVNEPYLHKEILMQKPKGGSNSNLIVKVDSTFGVGVEKKTLKYIRSVKIDTLEYKNGWLTYSSSTLISSQNKNWNQTSVVNYYYFGDTVKICKAVRKGAELSELQCFLYCYTQTHLNTKIALYSDGSVAYNRKYVYSNDGKLLKTTFWGKHLSFEDYIIKYEEGNYYGGNHCTVTEYSVTRGAVNINLVDIIGVTCLFDHDNNEIFKELEYAQAKKVRYVSYDNQQLAKVISIESEKILGTKTYKVKYFNTGEYGNSIEYIYVIDQASDFLNVRKRRGKIKRINLLKEAFKPYQIDDNDLQRFRLDEVIYHYYLVL